MTLRPTGRCHKRGLEERSRLEQQGEAVNARTQRHPARTRAAQKQPIHGDSPLITQAQIIIVSGTSLATSFSDNGNIAHAEAAGV